MSRRKRDQRLRAIVIGTGAGAMFASAFLPWIGGSVSRQPGYRLANLVLSAHTPVYGAPPWLVAADLYAVPIIGVVLWLLLILIGPTHLPRVLGAVHGGVALGALALAVPFLPASAFSSLGAGVYMAGAGALAVLLSAWA